MAEYSIKNYDLTDMESQSNTANKFNKKIESRFKKEKKKTDIKPEKIFEGYKKIKKN